MSGSYYDNVELNQLINDLKCVGEKRTAYPNNTTLTFQCSNSSLPLRKKPDGLNNYQNEFSIPKNKVDNVKSSESAETKSMFFKTDPARKVSECDLNRVEVDNLQKELSMIKNELAVLKRSHSLANHSIFGENIVDSGPNFTNNLITQDNSKYTSTPKVFRSNFSSTSNISCQSPYKNNLQCQSLTKLNALPNYSAHRESIDKIRKISNANTMKTANTNHSEKYYEETEDCTLQPIGKCVQTLTGSLSSLSKSEHYYNEKATAETISLKPSYFDQMKLIKLTKINWLKLSASRDECKMLLADKESGSFIVRIQSEYNLQIANGLTYELILKICNEFRSNAYFEDNYDYFYLKEFTETTVKGIKLIGHAIEPLFPTLDSFVMQHLDIPLGLPCCLKLPSSCNYESYKIGKYYSKTKLSLPFNIISKKLSGSLTSLSSMKSQITVSTYAQPQQAKLNAKLLFLGKVSVDRLNGLNAVRHAVDKVLINGYQPKHCIEVNAYFDSLVGVSIVDNERILFFKKFLSTSCIKYCEVDPLHRGLNSDYLNSQGLKNAKIFGILYQKRKLLIKENKVIVFAEFNLNTPMEDILKFVKENLIKQNIFN